MWSLQVNAKLFFDIIGNRKMKCFPSHTKGGGRGVMARIYIPGLVLITSYLSDQIGFSRFSQCADLKRKIYHP